MKSKTWWIKYILLGAINNIKYCLSSKKKESVLAYKSTRIIKVKTVYPEKWLQNTENERITEIGNNFLTNKIICKQ